MIRLLIGLALGYLAYRIVRETVPSIPEEFEPIPDPPRKPQPGAIDLAARKKYGRPVASHSRQR